MPQDNYAIADVLLDVSEELSEPERDRELGNIILEVYLAAMNRELDEIDALWKSQSQRYKSFRFNTEG